MPGVHCARTALLERGLASPAARSDAKWTDRVMVRNPRYCKTNDNIAYPPPNVARNISTHIIIRLRGKKSNTIIRILLIYIVLLEITLGLSCSAPAGGKPDVDASETRRAAFEEAARRVL